MAKFAIAAEMRCRLNGRIGIDLAGFSCFHGYSANFHGKTHKLVIY